MRIEERTPADPDLAGLLDAALAELVTKYGAEGRSAVRARARYLVAYVGDRAAGCGVVQPLGEEAGEIKRMYVAPEFRGQGIARKLLAALEDLALHLGYRSLYLATGDRQPEAIALYESSGYTPVEPYGKYAGQPLTRCYRKAMYAETEFPPGIGKVARRELALNGYTTYEQLSRVSAKQLLSIHGVGRKAIRILEEELAERGLGFAAG